jgi:hypothetical protein
MKLRPQPVYIIVDKDSGLPVSFPERTELAAKVVNFQHGYDKPMGEVVRYVPGRRRKKARAK